MGGIRTSYLFAILVLVAVAGYVDVVATIVGNVFCDQCRDGECSVFDVPINGAKVAVECRGSDGQLTMSMQETTDLIEDFVMKVDGTLDMSESGCNLIGSPTKALKLSFKLFSIEMYTVGSLFFQPSKPVASICPNTAPPTITPPHSPPTLPPTQPALPTISPPQNPPALPQPHPAPPAITLPPPPPTHSPPTISLPPLPFFQASTCSHEDYELTGKVSLVCLKGGHGGSSLEATPHCMIC